MEDIFSSEFYRLAQREHSDPNTANLDKELSLCGATSNKARRIVMLRDLATRISHDDLHRVNTGPTLQNAPDTYLAAHHKVTIKR